MCSCTRRNKGVFKGINTLYTHKPISFSTLQSDYGHLSHFYLHWENKGIWKKEIPLFIFPNHCPPI